MRSSRQSRATGIVMHEDRPHGQRILHGAERRSEMDLPVNGYVGGCIAVPSFYTPVNWGMTQVAKGDYWAPTDITILYPSLSPPPGAPLRTPHVGPLWYQPGCGKSPLIVFFHGQCDK